MAMTLGDLGNALFKELSQIVNGGDEQVRPDTNTFVTWFTPGLAFETSDFNFVSKGLGGGASAEEEKKMLQQAFAFANLVDFIPDPTAAHTADHQDRVWRSSEARMSYMYGEILRLSKVADKELTPEQVAEIDRLRGLLQTTRKSPVDGSEMVVDSPMAQEYARRMGEYIAAKMAYNNKRVLAMGATGPEGKAAVADFSMNGSLYKMQAENALRNWTTLGYKNDVEKIHATINQVTQRSSKLWKQRLLDLLEDSKVSALGPGQEFHYTTLMPADFMTSTGWQSYSASHEKLTESTRSTTSSWKAGASLKWGLFGASPEASGESKSTSADKTVSSFKISFEITQAVLLRAFFVPEWFMNQGWTLDKGRGWTFDAFPSDGGDPPKGNFVGYPTTLLFARNIVVESSDLATHVNEFSKSLGVGGKVGWGPFSLSGSYAKSSSGRDFTSENDGNSIKVPGVQALCAVNRLIGRAPNPMDGLKPEDFS
jgi:hypothetical protein